MKFMPFAALLLPTSVFLLNLSMAREKEKSIPCDDKRPRVVRVALGRVTVLNFPFKPKDVVPGSNAFDFKQIKNDLVIMSLKSGGHTNAVVYLEERRCTFDLISVKGDGDDVLIVKDPKDSQYEVKFHE
jgi:hypothetical protein